ncbi:hypothetical protein BB561_004923 [Smittium simulii]|uniref:Autophagy-related protein 29 n=1 Tax=Smittium simulii TaxID=133385 RepID=A0A2T9YDA2_9FUNG|nr:hypothetical protein BB561_004923 [Smittium simulii]
MDNFSFKQPKLILILKVPGARPANWEKPAVVYKNISQEQILWDWLKHKFDLQATKFLRSAVKNWDVFDAIEASNQTGIPEKNLRAIICAIYKKLYNRTIVDTAYNLQETSKNGLSDNSALNQPLQIDNKLLSFELSKNLARISPIETKDFNSVESLYVYNNLSGLKHSNQMSSILLHNDKNSLPNNAHLSLNSDHNDLPLDQSLSNMDQDAHSDVRANLKLLESDFISGISRLKKIQNFKNISKTSNDLSILSNYQSSVKDNFTALNNIKTAENNTCFTQNILSNQKNTDFKDSCASMHTQDIIYKEPKINSKLRFSGSYDHASIKDTFSELNCTTHRVDKKTSYLANSDNVLYSDINLESDLHNLPSELNSTQNNNESSPETGNHELNKILDHANISQNNLLLLHPTSDKKNYSELSESSAFSDFSDESVTRSALRDALMSQMESTSASSAEYALEYYSIPPYKIKS